MDAVLETASSAGGRIDLRDVKLGAPAAEREGEMLRRYFVESDSFRRLRDGEKTIALGNRGAGKTAIFKMIAEEGRNKKNVVVELSPEDYSYELLSQTLLPEDAGAWRKQSAYAAAWKWVLYLLAMKSMTTGPYRLKTGASAKIYNYLRDNHSSIETNPIGTLISYLKRLEGIKIGNIEASVRAHELQKLYKLEELNTLLPSLQELCAKRPVLMLVDELDRGWDASEDAKSFVAGLFTAAISINQAVPGFRVLLSLRRELYNSIPALYEDAQKIRDIIEVIEWDEASLLELVGKRIETSLKLDARLRHDRLWNLIFEETLDYRKTKSFNYMIDRTLYRPREVIQFCAMVRDAALDQKVEPPLNYGIISEAEISYSEARLKDIAAEYRFEYAGLESVFETFRGLSYNFRREDMEYHCLRITEGDLDVKEAASWCSKLDPKNIIEILWKVGFLRAQAVGGLKAKRRSGSSYLGPHQIGNLNLANLENFHIHPMFRTYLGMKESRDKSG